jgi:predicted membrane protein
VFGKALEFLKYLGAPLAFPVVAVHVGSQGNYAWMITETRLRRNP